MEILKGYKVLKEEGGRLFSVAMPKQYAVEYRVGEWTTPRPAAEGELFGDGPLMAFCREEQARNFIEGLPPQGLVLYECWYEKADWTSSEVLCALKDRGVIFYEGKKNVVWYHCERSISFCVPDHFPVGTVLCKAIQLTRKIEEWK